VVQKFQHQDLGPNWKTELDAFYRVRQKYLTILQNSCEWNRWRGKSVLERPTSEAQSISVAMERWSVEHRAFAVENYFKNNDSVLTQTIFRRHFNIHRNECP
jgi:intein/homing endonuclease